MKALLDFAVGRAFGVVDDGKDFFHVRKSIGYAFRDVKQKFLPST